jgi:uncharacterized SAM-binding protein YcdF (DUF218 family)
VAPEAVVSGRVVVVLGYSDGRDEALHPVCAARLAHAEGIAEQDDTIVLSGWSRRARHAPEAELMARAWHRPGSRLVLDPTARSTLGNAVNAAATVRAAGAAEVVVVTSTWHARRAQALFRAALVRSGVEVLVSASIDASPRRARLREAACWALVPAQAGIAVLRT